MSCNRCQQSGCNCSGGGSCACGCSDERLAPPSNRPGLAALSARLGDYNDFFGDAIGRLSDPSLPELRDLGTRSLDDPAIAWLDAWAIAADVLTFYRERLTNESYLRTAADEYSLRELAALIGFKPRPGIAATAYLAFLMEATAQPVQIPLPAKAQTMPGPGQQMQTFETVEPFEAHADWSQMSPRSLRPARITMNDALVRTTIRLKGSSLMLRPGERVLFVFDQRPGFQVVREVAAATANIPSAFLEVQLKPILPFEPDLAAAVAGRLTALRDKIMAAPQNDTTAFVLDVITSFCLGCGAVDCFAATTGSHVAGRAAAAKFFKEVIDRFPAPVFPAAPGSALEDVLEGARRLPAAQLSSSRQLLRTVGQGLSASGEERISLIGATTPNVGEILTQALTNLPVSPVSPDVAPSVFVLRVSAGAFGAAAPPKFDGSSIADTDYELLPEDKLFAFLDSAYDGVAAGSYFVFDRPVVTVGGTVFTRFLRIARVRSSQTMMRGGYNISAKSTRLDLVNLNNPKESVTVITPGSDENLGTLRNTFYHTQSEPVTLAADVDASDVAGSRIELQDFIGGLHSGQWVIVAGERTDLTSASGPTVPGVKGGELVMIGAVTQEADPLAPADTKHAVISLVTPLAYTYKRSSCIVYGNVVKSSHGETVSEVPGSGDASKAGQKFACARAPMTFTPAATTSGVEGSEVVRVNGVQHTRVDSLLDADGATRAYQLEVARDGSASLTFGDGIHGARLPSGSQNVRVDYRVGIGAAGNVNAGQISLLTTRPLGVTGVVNPLRSSGGSDRDGPERIRRNAPLVARALSPLSRLLSVQDYAEFALRFAGIGHAAAGRLSDGAQQIVHVTVAGVDDIPLDPTGDLLTNLLASYAEFGDPSYPVEIGVRELKVIMLQAKIGIDPKVKWDDVEFDLRARLLDYFSFDRRLLGQSAYLSEAIAVMQATTGVVWVDVDRFGGVTENDVRDAKALAAAMDNLGLAARVDARGAVTNPNWKPSSGEPRFLEQQLVFLVPEVPGLLVLNPA
jgi:hypothetical protein